MPPASYITLDVDLISSEDLSPLASYLEEGTFVLGHQQAEGLFYLSFEPSYLSESENTPENSARLILELLQSLPAELRILWESASSKVFNFGFDSGVSPPPYISHLSPETLGKIAALGAGMEITIYQHDSFPPEQEESE
ncbi:hypothetical protein [Aquipseudomonas alcaligenes]|uniref:DUF4279 domain-containing protein n=1 Tax=Aquipseudomonas alcaligenes TaxID=43263 RepID=A0AB73I334_AQUAC|nr:hypothetical protein [Pseudomonas alcaligenes]MDH0144607.1 hypothetical protein [Pseudomonas alcaligenes]